MPSGKVDDIVREMARTDIIDIDERPYDGATVGSKVVLCRILNNPVARYATWVESANKNRFWGHYFEGIVEAAHDFEERSK